LHRNRPNKGPGVRGDPALRIFENLRCGALPAARLRSLQFTPQPPWPLTPLPVGEGDKSGAFLTPRDKVPDICFANSGMMGSEGVLS